MQIWHPTATVRVLDLHLFTHQKDVRTPMFTAALSTIAKLWKQPKCPLMDKQIRKMRCIYTQ